MDAIRYMLGFLWRFAVGLVLLALVLWIVSVFFPAMSFRNIFGMNNASSTSDGDWLPDPRSYQGALGKAKVPTANDNVYKGGEAYNGYANTAGGYKGDGGYYITYTSEGSKVVKVGDSKEGASAQPTNGYAQRGLYIRNLSVYDGGHVHTGMVINGEARSSMFTDGKFPIIIASQSGNPLTIVQTDATTNFSAPGWVRFRAVIQSVLPDKVPCTLVFEAAARSDSSYNYSTTGKQEPIRVAIPVICN